MKHRSFSAQRTRKDSTEDNSSRKQSPRSNHNNDNMSVGSHGSISSKYSQAQSMGREASIYSQDSHAPEESARSRPSSRPSSVRRHSSASAGHTSNVTATAASTNNSNRIRNALRKVCLAGNHQSGQLEEALQCISDVLVKGLRLPSGKNSKELSQFEVQQLIVLLFEANTLSFRGIYAVVNELGKFSISYNIYF